MPSHGADVDARIRPPITRWKTRAQDVAELARSIGTPVFLLGHSYGAHCALLPAFDRTDCVEKLVLYEPPRPSLLTREALAALETLAAADD
jgi:pimeloyl-ACP methyl ester carboxylesterase